MSQNNIDEGKYPAPMPPPLFRLTEDDWDFIEKECSIKLDRHIKSFVIYYCNMYIYGICEFRGNNNNAREVNKLKNNFLQCEEFITLFKEVCHLRRDVIPLNEPKDEAGQKAFRIVHTAIDRIPGADSILIEEYAEAHGLSPQSYPARTAQRVFGDYPKFEENFWSIKNAFEELHVFFVNKLKNTHISKLFHGDPCVDNMTLRLWISFNKAGGKGKYSKKSITYISFMYKKMIEYYFYCFDKKVYAQIICPNEESVKNRIKHATTNTGKEKIKLLDTVFAFIPPEYGVPLGLRGAIFHSSLIGLAR